MRSIPLALKEKLSNRFKVESTDSQAKLRIIATQTSVNSLLSEPIHENINSGYGDVALRQIEGETDLSLAYAICLDDGTAKIYKRMLLANMEYPWEYQWTLGSATDVAIEFNGVWKMNAQKEWYFLQTEEYPYLFYVRNGDLYVQTWNDFQSVMLLASGVSQISACKGWQSSIDKNLDQGLVIGYLKNGSVYYRALCCQNNGSYLWEPEQEVTTLGTGNMTLSVIRTNDFRIGFLVQNNGKMILALTHRNYAGMSVRPETAHINVAKGKLWISEVNRLYSQNKEYAFVNVSNPYFLLDEASTQELVVTAVEKLTRETGFVCYGFKIRFSKPLYGSIDAGFIAKCTLSIAGVTISSATYDEEEQALILLTSADIRRTVAVTITMPVYRLLWYYKSGLQKWFFPALSAQVSAETITYDGFEKETASVSVRLANVWTSDITIIRAHQPTQTASIFVALATVSLQPVSNLPI